MKPQNFLITAAAILVAAAAFFLRPRPEILPAAKTTVTRTADGMSLQTTTDPTLVFQKAFWRQPASDDKILHAERREWSSEEGVKKWQWFIAVSPGPQLLEWLKTNPFSLAPAKAADNPKERPEWFPEPAAGFQIHQNAERSFILMLSADQKHLYATDSGLGFASPGTAP